MEHALIVETVEPLCASFHVRRASPFFEFDERWDRVFDLRHLVAGKLPDTFCFACSFVFGIAFGVLFCPLRLFSFVSFGTVTIGWIIMVGPRITVGMWVGLGRDPIFALALVWLFFCTK